MMSLKHFLVGANASRKLLYSTRNVLFRQSNDWKALESMKRLFSDFSPQNIKYKSYLKSSKMSAQNPQHAEKDLILYQCDGSQYLKIMNFFALTQLGFWSYTAHVLTSMKSVDIPVVVESDTEKPWWRKLDISYYKEPMGIAAFFIGWGVMAGCWMHTLRSVQHIVLRKGGKSITIASHTPIGTARFITVPLEKVSSHTGRVGRPYASVKVKGRILHYLVDTRGNFVRPLLYDKTVGVMRTFK